MQLYEADVIMVQKCMAKSYFAILFTPSFHKKPAPQFNIDGIVDDSVEICMYHAR